MPFEPVQPAPVGMELPEVPGEDGYYGTPPPRTVARARRPQVIPSIEDFVTSKEWLSLSVSLAQRTLLKTMYGVPLTDEQIEVWAECTRRTPEEYQPRTYYEVTVIAGARSGKDSRIAAPIALYEALFTPYTIDKGEVGVIPLVAQDQKATKIAFGYIRDYAEQCEAIRKWRQREWAQEILFGNPWGQLVKVQCYACTAKSVRGYSTPAAIMDEVAHFRSTSGKLVDEEMQTALRRGMVNFAHPRLVKISTPFARTGVLWDDYTRYFLRERPEDVNDDVLVWVARTTLMNPKITEARLERDRRLQRQHSRREYDAIFEDDDTTFLPAAWLDQAVAHGGGIAERPYVPGWKYIATVDPTGGGAAGDAFTLCVAHLEGSRIVQDVIRGWKGTRADTVRLGAAVAEIAAIIKGFHLYQVTGDHYAGDWPLQAFQDQKVLYVKSEWNKSQSYLEASPVFAEGDVALLAHAEQEREFRILMRKTRPGGRVPTIDHPPGAHDDHANATALAIAHLKKDRHPAIVFPPLQAVRDALDRDLALVSRHGRAAMSFWGTGDGRKATWARR
jgi:hypothetical protein